MILFLGIQEIVVVFLFVIIFFGADKIPGIARDLAKIIGYLRRTTDDVKREIMQSADGIENPITEVQKELTEAKNNLEKEVNETFKEVEGTFKKEL